LFLDPLRLFVGIPPDTHVTQEHMQPAQHPAHFPMAQAQRPANDRKALQPFGLIGGTATRRVMPEGPSTVAAAVAIHPHGVAMHIAYPLPDLSPTLKGFPFTITTLPGPSLAFPLDIRQLQHHNGHGELLAMAIFPIPILQGVRPFFKTHRPGDSLGLLDVGYPASKPS
jgi:hypothetical protein